MFEIWVNVNLMVIFKDRKINDHLERIDLESWKTAPIC